MKTFRVTDNQYSRLISPYCDLQNGPWVAGGSVRKVWQGKPWQGQDIDFFFRSPKQFRDLEDRITEIGNVVQVFKSDNAHSYTLDPDKREVIEIVKDVSCSIVDLNTLTAVSNEEPPPDNNHIEIQLIQKLWYDSAYDVISSFDVGISQFITDGESILATDQAIEDCHANRICKSLVQFKPVLPSRVIKYSAYGFEPNPDIFLEAVKTVLTEGVKDDSY